MSQGRVGKGKGKVTEYLRPKMTAYAFFIDHVRNLHKENEPDNSITMKHLNESCAARWKEMNSDERKPYYERQGLDAKRYDEEKLTKVLKPKIQRKSKAAKDPRAPKRSMSSYMWFCRAERPKVMEAHPEFQMKVVDAAKELGRLWKLVTPETKAKFEHEAMLDKARYTKEKKEYDLLLKREADIKVRAKFQRDVYAYADETSEEDSQNFTKSRQQK